MASTFGGAEALGMHRILINGAWVDALTESGREIRNPATLDPLGRVPDCGKADVAREK
jgi:hypothetical protein